MLRLLKTFATLGAIIGPLPNNITDGQAVDAIPVMADLNWIVSQVNANAASLTTTNASITALQTTVNAYGLRAPFTPSVQFGGASAGLTYVAQVGYQFPLQNCIFVVGSLIMSNIGVSVGAMTVTGFPTSAALAWAVNGFPIHIVPSRFNIPGSTGGNAVMGSITPGTGTMNIIGPTGSTATVDSNFSQLDVVNGSGLSFMGVYPIS